VTKNRSNRFLILLGQAVLVLALVSTFTALALWQWDRAKAHQELERELDQIAALDPVPLISIHKPQVALDGEITNRMVTLTGRYLDSFIARGQVIGEGPETEKSSYHVALFEVDGSRPRAGILVAREIINSQAGTDMKEPAELLARLLPAQREDRDPAARSSGDQQDLVRIDSALLPERITDPSLALYDGYLLLHRETRAGVNLDLALIPDEIAEPTIPGYYWQHISYVIIWFLMAALTLYLPLYQRRRNRLMRSE
jgi:hypothetical protein